MLSKVSPDLLNDTLNLLQLARETALAKGNRDQAERIAPVADNLRDLVNTSRQSKQPAQQSPIMGQSDFRTILSAVQSSTNSTSQPTSPAERNQVVAAMSDAGMSDIDIARHLGLARDEVRLIVSLGKRSRSSGEM